MAPRQGPGGTHTIGRVASSRPWLVGTAVAGLLGAGAAVAWQVGAALGLSFRPAEVPGESPATAEPREVAAAPLITRIVVPDDRRVRLAAQAVAAALSGRAAPHPVIRTAATAGATALPRTLRAEVIADPAVPDEAFRLRRAGGGFLLQASTAAGAAAGLYTLADRIRSGDDPLPPGGAQPEPVFGGGGDGPLVAPRLRLRLVDTGSVGLSADPAGFVASDDYSLNTDVVAGAVLAGPPYVDRTAVGRIAAQFRQLVDHALGLGYNGVVVPGFLEYVTFAGVGDGSAVYPAGDPHAARARAMVAAFGPVWRYAHDMGMRVYFATDMLALSPPLERYLGKTVGGLAVRDPRLWTVYQAGLRELFAALPYADGLVIRVGEGGASYQLPGWDYTSRIVVKTPASVRAMLAALLGVAGETGRDIIFRTWSIGVGAVGDMHTSPASYEEVLGGIDDPHLIVSTKYCLGDFYSHLPLNTTLAVGTQRRIVEFQARREFEAFGSLPNDLGALHQEALRRLLAANPRIEGVWTWTQMGGPLRAGPRTLYLRAGFWQLFELNVYLTARLAWNPDADPGQLTADWARQAFATDPSTVEAIGRVMALSREAIMKGLYIGPYASRTVKALGVQPPPMMWIFEWDIVTGDSAVLDSIYAVSRDRLDDAIREGDTATALARRMRALIAGTDPAAWHDPVARQQFLDTLDYQVNLFETLGAYRTMFLRYAQWLDTGSPAARAAWVPARARYRAARDEHLRRYTGNVDLPPYRFPAADIGLARAQRDLAMAWLARALLLVLIAAVTLGSPLGQRLLRALARGPAPGAAALRALWVGAVRPWRLGDLPPPAATLDRVLVWAVPAAALVLSRAVHTWFAAPTHLLLTLGAWSVFAGALRALIGTADPFRLLAGLGGAVLVRTLVLLGALVERGPGRYWFGFWTRPAARSGYITLAFAAFLWVFAVAWLALMTYVTGPRAAGLVLVGAGAPLTILGAAVSTTGLERALTMWNDEMALLPWGMSRILGITGFLDIPASLPRVGAVVGGVVMAGGTLLAGGVTPRAAVRHVLRLASYVTFRGRMP